MNAESERVMDRSDVILALDIIDMTLASLVVCNQRKLISASLTHKDD